MKKDGVKYEKIFQIIKNKIESGLLPAGSELPSRADLCEEYQISEKTVRRVVGLLADAKYVETTQRKRPAVIFDSAVRQCNEPVPLKKANSIKADDIFKTAILICYPLISYGMSLCSTEDWKIPETIISKMDPSQATCFWRRSNQLWRFFISRIGSEFILRTVDSLGLSELNPLAGTNKQRSMYYETLKKYLYAVKRRENTEDILFDDLSSLYTFISGKKGAQVCRVMPDSPLRNGAKGLERKLQSSEERYSNVYLDILGLIAVGRYQPGDRIPTHAQMQKIYGVSVDTTLRAIRILQQWGVVEAIRGKGIFVTMDLKALGQIQIDPDLIACHIRRYLDSLQMLSLTVKGVAAHAAVYISQQKVIQLKAEIENLWNNKYLYQLSPIILLEFLIGYIHYDALKAIYKVILNNYHIGRRIPKLINHKKNENNHEIHRMCLEICDILINGTTGLFAEKTAALYQHIQRLIVEECKRLGYWNAAMRDHDGKALWK